MVREFTAEEWGLYAGAISWSPHHPGASIPGCVSGCEPLICELGEWTFIASYAGTEVHRLEEREGSTITVYAADFAFPTQRFAYSWLFAITVIFSMYGKFDPAEYCMEEIATI